MNKTRKPRKFGKGDYENEQSDQFPLLVGNGKDYNVETPRDVVVDVLPDVPWWKRQPYFIVTVTIIDCILMGYAIYLNKGIEKFSSNPLLGPKPQILIQMGAKYGPLIEQGQWWRFFTPMFLHVGILHLLFNLVFQLRTGIQIEKDIGTLKVAAVYLISGIGGNLSSAVFLPLLVTVGASGALFGLIGLILVSYLKNWGAIHRPCCGMGTLLLCIVFNLAIGLLPMVDNFCHLGGFFTGIFLSCILLPAIVKMTVVSGSEVRVHYLSMYCNLKGAIFSIVGGICLLALFVSGFYVFYHHLDMNDFCKWCIDLDCPPSWSLCKQFVQAEMQT